MTDEGTQHPCRHAACCTATARQAACTRASARELLRCGAQRGRLRKRAFFPICGNNYRSALVFDFLERRVRA
jgi:hypothetical protein